MRIRHTDAGRQAERESFSGSGRRRAAIFAAAFTLAGCAGPLAESATARPPAAAAGHDDITIVRSSGSGGQGPAARDAAATAASRADPFALDARLRQFSDSLIGDGQAKIMQIFDRLHRGGSEGVTVMEMGSNAPRTASEALAQGGDCTDLANIVVSLMRANGIPGGALLVHFDSAPAGVHHMVPYVTLGGNRIIVDLQAERLGQTIQGSYTEVLSYTLEEAAAMYHREMGDYHRDAGRGADAMESYRASLAIFERDPYVHQNLGILLERSGDVSGASARFSRAAELDPRYAREAARGDYNAELRAAQAAADAGRWSECVAHLRNALSSPEPDEGRRRQIEENIRVCEENAAATGQKKKK